MVDELEQANALDLSIQHWKKNSYAKTPKDASVGRSDCDLCTLYNPAFRFTNSNRCAGCPVCEDTGIRFCVNTPFPEAEHAYICWKNNPDNEELGDEFRAAARREYEYLLSLKKP